MTALLVANNGGHIMQLHSLSKRLRLHKDRVWVTTPTPQTQSLLKGEVVHWVAPAPTRDWRAVFENSSIARDLFGKHRFTRAVSTGSSLALSVLPQAHLRGIPCNYIESATRTSGPSVSGKLLSLLPGMGLHTQHRSWATGRWNYIGSVFDEYISAARPNPPGHVKNVVVSLGTSDKYSFARLLERLVKVIPDDAEVLWQTGSTDTTMLPIDGVQRVSNSEMNTRMRDADVVISHAGTGVALSALAAGKFPILVPRRPEFDEHVDNHQVQIAQDLDERGLALVREVEDIEAEHLMESASMEVVRAQSLPMLDW